MNPFSAKTALRFGMAVAVVCLSAVGANGAANTNGGVLESLPHAIPDSITTPDFEKRMDVSLSQPFQDLLDRQNLTSKNSPGMVLAVHIPNKGMWKGAAGNAAKLRRVRDENGQWVEIDNFPMNADDQFLIASITKTFVATVVHGLLEEKRIGLTDTIEQWLPGGIVANAEQITVRQLLTHTSGVKDYYDLPECQAKIRKDPFRKPPTDELISLIRTATPDFEPGRRFNYSNSNFVLLVMIAEAVIDPVPFEMELREKILAPLDLGNTFFGGREDCEYIPAYGGEIARDLCWHIGMGNMVSNAEDVLRFGATLFEGGILQPATLDEMMIRLPGTLYSFYDGYGLRIFFWREQGGVTGTLVGHLGAQPMGHISFLMHHRESGATIVLLHNTYDLQKAYDASYAAMKIAQGIAATTGISDWFLSR